MTYIKKKNIQKLQFNTWILPFIIHTSRNFGCYMKHNSRNVHLKKNYLSYISCFYKELYNLSCYIYDIP